MAKLNNLVLPHIYMSQTHTASPSIITFKKFCTLELQVCVGSILVLVHYTVVRCTDFKVSFG